MGAKPVKPSAQLTISIKGQKWRIRFYPLSKFESMYPGCVGMTHYSHELGFRTINFLTWRLSKATIAHEVMHAILSYRDLSKKSPGAIEEMVCEEIGHSYKRITTLADKIYRFYRKAALRTC